MATKYAIQIVSPSGEFSEVAVRARKDAAIKFGDSLDESYRVVTDAGKVVHEFTRPDDFEQDLEDWAAEKEASAPTDAPEPETAEENEPEDAAPSADEEVAADEDVNARVGSEKFDVAKLKKKIAKMLAKAERTDNEHERETFTAAAERMMLRLGIQIAELEAEGEVKPEEIVEVQREWGGIYATTLTSFTNQIAIGFGNLTILQSSRGQRRRVVHIIGHKSDVEQFTTLVASLHLQAMSALKRYQVEQKESRAWATTQEKFVQDRSFLQGFATQVSVRLSALRIETEAEATTGAALVLASKMDRINDHMAEAYPKLGKARGGARQYSSHGLIAGKVAGATANIGGKSVGSGSKGELA